MSHQLLIVLTRPSGQDEWEDWTLETRDARFALLGRHVVEEHSSRSIPPGIVWPCVDICLVRGGRDGSWKIIGELVSCVPAEIDLRLLIHGNRNTDPTWIERKVQQINVSSTKEETLRGVLSKYRGYGLGDGDEGERNRSIIISYVTAAHGQGNYEKALEEIKRLFFRPSLSERIGILKHRLGLRLFNGLAAEIDYIANCMQDERPDEALRILGDLLADSPQKTGAGRFQFNRFQDWVHLLQQLVGGSLLSSDGDEPDYSVGGLLQEYLGQLAVDGFRQTWNDLILLVGLQSQEEEELGSLPRLERVEQSPITQFMDRLDRLADKQRQSDSGSPITREEVKSLIGEGVWRSLRDHRWAVGGESVTSFSAWFRQLDSTLDGLREYLVR